MDRDGVRQERSRESREQRENKDTARGRAWKDCERVGKGQGTRVWSKEDAWIRAESVHVSHPCFTSSYGHLVFCRLVDCLSRDSLM